MFSQIVMGIVVAIIVEKLLAKSSSANPQITYVLSADGMTTIPQISDAQAYDLNYFPNAPAEVAAASGIDTGDSVASPNATPTFVGDEGSL